jgi:hypothetical protein
MKAILRATVAILSLASIGTAYAESAQDITQFTQIPTVVAQAPSRNATSVDIARSGDSQSGHGPWLFPPIGKYLDQQAGG